MCTIRLGMCRPAHCYHAYELISWVNPTPYVLVTVCPCTLVPMSICSYGHACSPYTCMPMPTPMPMLISHPWPATVPPTCAMAATNLGLPIIPTFGTCSPHTFPHLFLISFIRNLILGENLWQVTLFFGNIMVLWQQWWGTKLYMWLSFSLVPIELQSFSWAPKDPSKGIMANFYLDFK